MNKKKIIRFRCTPLEKALIEKKAETSGRSVSEFVRDVSLSKQITYKLTDEELKILKVLHEFRSNFNRISNLIRRKDSQLLEEIKSTNTKISNALDKFQ